MLVCLFYLMTFMLMLVKSRLMNIGVDVSYLFEPRYMALMLNRIVDSIPMDVQ